MATTTARRYHSVLTSTLAVGALLLAACSGGDETVAPIGPTDDRAAATAPAATAAFAPTPTVVAGTVEGPEASDSTDDEPSESGDGATATTAPSDDSGVGDSTSPDPTTPPAPGTTDPPDSASDTTADTAIDPTTAPPPAPTTDPPPDPVIDPGGVDWTGIATDLLARHFEIPRQPSFDLVRAVCLEPSGCFDDAARTVEVLLGDGVRLVGGAPFEVVSVEFQGTADGAAVADSLAVNLLVRFVATDQGVIQLVDADGQVVSDVAPDDRFAPGQPATRAVILGRDGAGAGWKLVALSDWM